MSRDEGPRNERGRRTRAAVLDATWDLLGEVGPDGTTMSAVAERAGVSRRALYLHFASRAELLLAVHEHVDERLDLDASIAPVYEAPDAVGALEAFAAHLARYHPVIAAVDLALARASGTDPDVTRLVERGQQVWHDACRQLAGRLAAEDRLAAPWTVDEAADLLWSWMFPDTLLRLTAGRAWTTERYGELLTVLLRRTLVRDDGPASDRGQRPPGTRWVPV